jgi:multisubunit Na+/H+ antiporter MnhB subunit
MSATVTVLRIGVMLGAAAFAWLLADSLFALPAPAIDLRPLVSENLAQSGVTHPVTAVLLNFRGFDTLLEIAVMLVALLGVLATLPADRRPAAVHEGGDAMLPLFSRVAVPLMLLCALYLLWAGAFRPGGAFQAGALLAAALALLHLARLIPAWPSPLPLLRSGLIAGFLVFLAIATALLTEGALLQYPPAYAGLLILAIESALTVSLALILAGLFLFISSDGRARK